MRLTAWLLTACVPLSLTVLSACGTIASASHPTTSSTASHSYGVVAARTPSIPINGGVAGLSVVSASVQAAILNGQLAITDNRGKTWHTHNLPNSASPAALDFVSATTGFLIAWTGPHGDPALFKTSNGGQNWTHEMTTPTSNQTFPQIDMVSAQDGWAILSSTLYRTIDGGRQWSPVQLGSGIPASVDFVDPTHGWVVMHAQSFATTSLLETSDGIHFHTILTTPNGIGALSLNSATSGEVLETAPGGTMELGPVLKTTDSGSHWTTLASSQALAKAHAYGDAGGMAFQGNTGWIGTNNGAQGFTPLGLLVTSNGGKTWHPAQPKLGWAIQSLTMTGPGTGWIVAGQPMNQFLAHTHNNGRTWTIAWPPASPHTVDFVTPTRGFGMGLPNNSEAVVRTRNGGKLWTLAEPSPPRPFNTQAFSPSLGLGAFSTFVSSGAESTLYRSTDGGARWTVQKTFLGQEINALQFLGNNTWAMTVQNNLDIHTHVWISRDNGRHWKPLEMTVRVGTTIDAVNAHAFWVVQDPNQEGPDRPIRVVLEDARGRVLRTVLSLPSSGPVSDFVSAMSFLNTQDGWVWVNKFVRSNKMIKKPGARHLVRSAPTISNLLYYTTDGGLHWTQWKLPSDWGTATLQLVTPTVGFMDMNGVVLKTTDGGGSWTEVSD